MGTVKYSCFPADPPTGNCTCQYLYSLSQCQISETVAHPDAHCFQWKPLPISALYLQTMSHGLLFFLLCLYRAVSPFKTSLCVFVFLGLIVDAVDISYMEKEKQLFRYMIETRLIVIDHVAFHSIKENSQNIIHKCSLCYNMSILLCP